MHTVLPASVARRTLATMSWIATAVLMATTPLAARAPLAEPSGTDPDYRLRTVLSGYSRPDFVTASGSNRRLFIVEQGGRIKVATRPSVSAPWKKAGTFLDIGSKVLAPETGGGLEQGLLGLAFHPDYADNGLFYVFYTRRSSDPQKNGDSVLAEYHRETNLRADPDSARVVLRLEKDSDHHYGGWIAFGPDGYLYAAIGDDARGFRSLNITGRFGKILRFDPVDPDGDGPAHFSAPPDNPYVGVVGDDLVWTLGLRNPFRASHDRQTGDLWIGDVGRLRFEEIDHATGSDAGKGVNYGWWLCEGEKPHRGTADDCGPPPNTSERPVLVYKHSVPAGQDNCAVAGGYVYRGTLQPALRGRYFFSDYCSGRLWAIPTDQTINDPEPTPLDTAFNVVSLGEDSEGELYAVDLGGRILRVVER